MGVKFSKEMVIGQEQVVPMINAKMELTPVQEKLLKKLGPNAYPFTFNFPDMAPSSVKRLFTLFQTELAIVVTFLSFNHFCR